MSERLFVGVDFHQTFASASKGFMAAYPGAKEQLELLHEDPNIELVMITAFPRVRGTNGRLIRAHAEHVGMPKGIPIIHGKPLESRFGLLHAMATAGRPSEEHPNRLILIDNGGRRILRDLDGFEKMPMKSTAVLFGLDDTNEDYLHPSGTEVKHMKSWKDLRDLLGLTPDVGLEA